MSAWWLLGLAAAVFADTVYLKNGNQLEGVVQSETRGEVVVDIGFGTTTVPRADVRRIRRSGVRQREALKRRHRSDAFDSGRWVPKGSEKLFEGYQRLRARRETANDAKIRREALVEERGRLLGELERLDGQAKWAAMSRVHEIALLLPGVESEMQAYLAEFRDFGELLARQGKPAPGEEEEFRSELNKALGAMEEDFEKDAVDSRREGSHLIVSVVFNGKVRAKMLVDTGASVTSLTPVLAERVEPSSDRDGTAQLTLGDGRKVKARRFQAKSIEVGRTKVEGADVVVLPPPGPGLDGLLGMSFLEHFSTEVDLRNGKLLLKRLR
ncbi:MAG: clan AA aspartic protease [Elusimicrobia bacterium]|nr:clan AA aspartic protease [Elusimicrobiota bacterium]